MAVTELRVGQVWRWQPKGRWQLPNESTDDLPSLFRIVALTDDRRVTLLLLDEQGEPWKPHGRMVKRTAYRSDLEAQRSGWELIVGAAG